MGWGKKWERKKMGKEKKKGGTRNYKILQG